MSQLQEMQITSPGFVENPHQNSPTQHEVGVNFTNVSSTPFMVQLFRPGGRAPPNSNNMQHQFFQSNPLSPIEVSSNSITTLNDYSPSNWPTSLANALTGTNTIHLSLLPSNNQVNNTTGYPEIVMEDLSNLQVYLI